MTAAFLKVTKRHRSVTEGQQSKGVLKRNRTLELYMTLAEEFLRATRKQPSGTEKQQSKDTLKRMKHRLYV